MKHLIQSNYDSILSRGLINKDTTYEDFLEKLYEEVGEFDDALCRFIESDPASFRKHDDMKEELADVILVCLNFAKHYDIDIELELTKKIMKNKYR